MDNQALDGILQCLSDHSYSVLDLVTGVLSWHNPDSPCLQLAKEDLEHNAMELCTSLLAMPQRLHLYLHGLSESCSRCYDWI